MENYQKIEKIGEGTYSDDKDPFFLAFDGHDTPQYQLVLCLQYSERI